MSVIYTAIARQDVVFCNAAKTEKQKKEFYASIHDVLQSFGTSDNMRASKQQNNMNFYILIQNGVQYLCFTDSQVPKGTAYAFLQEISNQFTSKYQPSAYKFAQELSLDTEMSNTLLDNMSNIKKFGNKSQELQSNLDEVKGLVMDNIAKVMSRAQNLDEIAESALQLKDNADEFVVSTKAVKNQMLKKKIMIIIGIIIAVIAIILIIVLPIVL